MIQIQNWTGYDDWLTKDIPDDDEYDEAIDCSGVRGGMAEAEDAGCDEY